MVLVDRNQIFNICETYLIMVLSFIIIIIVFNLYFFFIQKNKKNVKLKYFEPINFCKFFLHYQNIV